MNQEAALCRSFPVEFSLSGVNTDLSTNDYKSLTVVAQLHIWVPRRVLSACFLLGECPACADLSKNSLPCYNTVLAQKSLILLNYKNDTSNPLNTDCASHYINQHISFIWSTVIFINSSVAGGTYCTKCTHQQKLYRYYRNLGWKWGHWILQKFSYMPKVA